MRALAAIAVVILSLIGYVIHDINKTFGYKRLDFNDGNCELIAEGVLRGGEDLQLWYNGVAIVSAGDLRTTFRKGPEHAQLTGIFLVDLPSLVGARQSGRTCNSCVRLARLDGYPSQSPIVGHGMYLSNQTQRLYVVNHADNISTIEIFSIHGQSMSDISLVHVDTIRSELFQYQCVNDVVEGRTADEVFVSIWRDTVGVEDYVARQSRVEIIDTALYRYVHQSFGRLGILRCTRTQGQWGCEKTAAWQIPSANGMTVSPDRKVLLMICPGCATLFRYRISKHGELTEVLPRIALPYAADNLDWDDETGQVYIAMMPIIDEHQAAVPCDFMAIPATEVLEPFLSPRSLLVHSGTKLSQCSAGLRYGNATLIGSPYSAGLLFCDSS
eukprot:TRINITY_DN70321_c0_g1_i1.p1 TRINITY_DN70321_c0_g1~~TRINITY_DN70321_c0_g1_i1.p1  ORF type:complete len:385 (-),score=27.18 TRINITY_DN70321_c0_g1_i1:74-1228(-)